MHSRAVRTAMERMVSFYVRANGSDEEGTFVETSNDTPFLPFAGIAAVPIENSFSRVSLIMTPDSKKETEMIIK